MIKASALLVALAIGLLVAGVAASNLLMVYVSIGVCAVAALLLAAGVLAHWSEIFGRREARPATPGAWSEPQVNVTAPVLASIQAVAVARGSARPRPEEASVRPPGARSGSGRPVGERPSGGRPDRGRADGGRVPERPAEVVPSPAEVAGRGDEFPAPRRSDDLWERVEEELGSAAKRDTGALSWPATVFPPVRPDAPEPAESAGPAPEAEPLGEPPGGPQVGAGAWLWGSGAGWQPETADPAWPPPAAAFAEPQAAPELAEPEPAEPEPAAPEPVEPEPEPEPEPAAGAPRPGGPGDTASTPVPDETAAGPAADAEVAQDVDVAEDAAAALDDDAALDDGVVPDGDVVPDGEAASDKGPASDAADHQAPAARETTAEEPGPERSAVKESAAEPPGADAPGPDAPAAGKSAVKEPAAEPAPGRVEVTVVPGVSRYHRSECILIRFLGAGDLEIMTKQEAVDAKFMACRACQPDLLED
ncbi:MAG TPA: hypothetical protein VE464_00075 [Streptosporangiaceae bacterium]|nr:hypothetical protein [Streptosporangiaceae bacterium]